MLELFPAVSHRLWDTIDSAMYLPPIIHQFQCSVSQMSDSKQGPLQRKSGSSPAWGSCLITEMTKSRIQRNLTQSSTFKPLKIQKHCGTTFSASFFLLCSLHHPCPCFCLPPHFGVHDQKVLPILHYFLEVR